MTEAYIIASTLALFLSAWYWKHKHWLNYSIKILLFLLAWGGSYIIFSKGMLG